jgi:hypothetical protein
MLGYYPYKAKSLYKNGCYFGMHSKTRWHMKYYHKGNELREKIKDSLLSRKYMSLLKNGSS